MERATRVPELVFPAGGMNMLEGPTADNKQAYKAFGFSGSRTGELSRLPGKTVTGNLGTPIMAFAQFWSPFGYIVGLQQEESSLDGEQFLLNQSTIDYGLDPYWDQVLALVHFDTTLPFVDAKSLTALVEIEGTVESVSDDFKFGPRSMYAPVSEFGPTLSLDLESDIFDLFNYSAWTIEFWVKLETLPGDDNPETAFGLMSCVDYDVGNDKGWGISIGESKLFWNNDQNNTPVEISHSIEAGQWYAVCVMRSGSTVYFFQNGRRVGTSSVLPEAITPADSLGIEFGYDALTGTEVTPDGEFNGWLDEFRLTSVARYPITGYTVSSRAFADGGPDIGGGT